MPRRPTTPRKDGPSLTIGALVEAEAAYNPEAKGYVRLICGDLLELLHARCEEGFKYDSFLWYAYGRRVQRINATQGRDIQKLDGEDNAGWFPFDLVRPVLTPTPSLPPSIGECTSDGPFRKDVMPLGFTLVEAGAAYTTEERFRLPLRDVEL